MREHWNAREAAFVRRNCVYGTSDDGIVSIMLVNRDEKRGRRRVVIPLHPDISAEIQRQREIARMRASRKVNLDPISIRGEGHFLHRHQANQNHAAGLPAPIPVL